MSLDPTRAIARALLGLAFLITLLGSALQDTTPQYIPPTHQTAAMAIHPPDPHITTMQSQVIREVVAQPTLTQHIPLDHPNTPPAASGGSFEHQLKVATIRAYGEGEWPAMRQLIMHESGMNPYAVNPSSGACSAFQFLPCSKLGAPMSDFENQIRKGIAYISARYTTPSRALAYWHCIGQCTNNYGTITKTATWY